MVYVPITILIATHTALEFWPVGVLPVTIVP